MTERIYKYGLLLALLLPSISNAQALDTAGELSELIYKLKSFKSINYNYVMDVQFPNGDKDHIAGTAYINSDDKYYYNDCDAFTMIYSVHWLYKADHRKKTILIVDLDKEKDKKAQKNMEAELFRSTAVTAFFDSIVLKKAVVKLMKKERDLLTIILVFPPSLNVQQLDVVYNKADNFLVSYNMTVSQPWQKTPKGIQVAEAKMKCRDFRKVPDKNAYSVDNFFAYQNDKLELKKYRNYKLSTKA